jgi:prepilin peptidase CpaA
LSPEVILPVTVALVAAAYDWKWRIIPNWLCVTGLIAGLIQAVIKGAWAESLTGVGLSLLIYLPLYLVRGVGGGDVKLMLAMGAILGKSQWLVLFVFTAVLGGVIAVVILVLQGKLRKGFSNVLTILKAASQGKAAHSSIRRSMSPIQKQSGCRME